MEFLAAVEGRAREMIEFQTGKEISFLEKGQLNAVGLGGSLTLDYEHYRENYEIDVELRYTDIYLQSIPGTSEGVKGAVLSQNLNLWSRWRAPIGLTALRRPVRYVLEFTFSHYFGNQRIPRHSTISFPLAPGSSSTSAITLICSRASA